MIQIHEAISRSNVNRERAVARDSPLSRFIKDTTNKGRFFTVCEVRTRLIRVHRAPGRAHANKLPLKIPHFSVKAPAEIRAIEASGNTERAQDPSVGVGRRAEREPTLHVFFDAAGPNKSGRDRALDTRLYAESTGGRVHRVIRWLVPPVFPPAIQFAAVSRPAALFLLDK